MTDLTDAELALVDAEHYPHPDGGGDCLSCCRVWPCIESRAIAERRELRIEADNAGVRSSWGEALAFISTIAKEHNKLRADNERLRAALVEIKRPHFGLGYDDPMDEQRDYWERWALKYRDIADDALGVKGGDA